MMEKKDYQNELSVHCGKKTDSMENLAKQCEEEAEKLLDSLNIPDGGEVSVPFWTSDFFSEFICRGRFRKDEKGTIAYDLDFSESTL
ncbi:hypothetical protein AB9N12_16975 [Bacteroides sp. AN502(2024)]|uniref:hypothetical protein n=1 Tax=Bacteroides sp. AN502(2024) TaxID=3160599 RepID=UPI0035184151